MAPRVRARSPVVQLWCSLAVPDQEAREALAPAVEAMYRTSSARLAPYATSGTPEIRPARSARFTADLRHSVTMRRCGGAAGAVDQHDDGQPAVRVVLPGSPRCSEAATEACARERRSADGVDAV